MQELLPIAEKLGALLKARHETIAIAESSTGGLISAALLSVPGASAYFLGGSVVYTMKARRAVLDIGELPEGMRASTEAYATLMAQTARRRFEADWALGETGATGPAGNRYGDAAGHSCIAVAGAVARAMTIETGSSERVSNMRAFAAAAMEFLLKAIEEAPRR